MQNKTKQNKIDFFKLLTNNSSDIISVVSANGTIFFESNATKRILGYDSGKRNSKNVFDFVHPNDKEAILKEFNELVNHPNIIKTVEFRYLHENGSWIWLEACGQNLLSNKEINGILINSRDITNKKKEEQKLIETLELNYAILHSTQDCFKTLDLEGNLLSINNAGQTLLEIEDITPFLNHSWIDFWKGQDYINAKAAIEKARNGDIGYFEGYCPTAKGSPKWWGVLISPIYNKTGEVHQLLSVSRDITKQKSNDKQLKEKIKQLHCIQQLGSLVEQHETIEDILANFVHVLQDSLQNSNYKNVIITFDKHSFQTREFRSGKPVFSTKIKSRNKEVGKIEIVLNNNFEYKISEEEKSLINIVTERLGRIIERIQQRKNYAYLFDALYEAILKADSNGVITEANHAAAELCGYNSPDDLIGTHMEQLYANSNTRTRILKKLEKEGDVFHNFEFQLKQKNGNTVWTLCNIRLLRNSNGEYIGTLGALRDISDYKIVKQALSESEEKLNLAQEIGKIGSYSTNLRTQKWSGSKEFCRMFGFVYGKEYTTAEFQEIVSPDYREDVMKYFNQCLKNQKNFNYEYKAVNKKTKRELFVRSLSKVIYDNSGTPLRIEGIKQDITKEKTAKQALKESEIRLKQIIENTEDLIFIQNLDYQYIYYNGPAKYKLKPKDVLGKTPSDFFDAKKANRILNILQNVLKTKKRVIKEETIEWNGEIQHFIDEISPVFDKKGNLIAFSTISRNITKLKKTEQALIESEAKYRELNATKDKFFSIISHDLKNPLNAILNFSDLALLKAETEEYDKVLKYCKIIRSASKQNLNLLTNLLQWSRLQTGQMDFNPKLFNLREIVQEIIDLLHANYREKNIEIIFHVPKNLCIFADKFMLETTIRNLLSNAIKFTAENGWIKISAKQQNNDIQIAIEDNGIGISKEDMDKLFRIESSFSTDGTRNEKGSGLGLILSKEFIEKHGGKIWVESKENKGTKFCFIITQ